MRRRVEVEEGSGTATGPDSTCQHIWGKVCEQSHIQAFLGARVLAERWFPVNPSLATKLGAEELQISADQP